MKVIVSHLKLELMQNEHLYLFFIMLCYILRYNVGGKRFITAIKQRLGHFPTPFSV